MGKVRLIDKNYKDTDWYGKDLYIIAKYHYLNKGSDMKTFYIVSMNPNPNEYSSRTYFGESQLEFL